MPNTEMMRMRPQAPAEQSPMSEPGPINESDWLAQIMMERQKMPQQPTLGSYIANMRSTIDPSVPQMKAAPAPRSFAEMIPGLSDLWSMLQGKPAPDATIDHRLGQQAGAMFQNNQRHVQALDDFERERARNAMLLSQLQGLR